MSKIAVFTAAGVTQLTHMPVSASSLPSDWVKASKRFMMAKPQARYAARDDRVPACEVELLHMVMPPSML
jgi:hypothetical protein